AELAGDFPLAEKSLLAAADRSTLYQPRYLLAQYYFRRQNADSFWRWSREAVDTAYGQVTALLDLNWRMRPDADWIWRHAIPPRPEIIRQYLTFLAGKGQWGTAQSVAAEMAASATMDDRPVLLDYCERRLSHGDGPGAMTLWNALCRRGLLPYRPLDPVTGPYITSEAFDGPPLETGFAWRLTPPPGIRCALRNHQIRLHFSGLQQEQCTILWQYVPVEPARHYCLQFEIQPKVPGVMFRALDLDDTTTDGSQFQSAANNLVKLALVYRRPLGSVPFEGDAVITSVSLKSASRESTQ
ncbi:MAG: hypothetical protein ABI822_11450, partial [Bryobacteraceae bacterium]